MQLRLLVVDDNVQFLEQAHMILKREGVAVVGIATSTAEALERVDELRPDVALIDIRLGNENGFDLARRLASDSVGRGARLIMMSSQAEEDFRELIEASPAVGFLPKSRLSIHAIREAVRGDGRVADLRPQAEA